MKRICISGPESSGKSELAQFLANHLQCPWAPEFSRDYLASLKRPYHAADLDQIALGQVHAEQRAENTRDPFLFCDTGPEVVYVWSEYKYGRVSPQIEQLTSNTRYHLTLLMDVDLPWQPDPLRETPDPGQRRHLLQRYQTLLTRLGRRWTLISGSGSARQQAALEALDCFSRIEPANKARQAP